MAGKVSKWLMNNYKQLTKLLNFHILVGLSKRTLPAVQPSDLPGRLAGVYWETVLYLTSRRGATRYCSICGYRGHDVVSFLGFSFTVFDHVLMARGGGI